MKIFLRKKKQKLDEYRRNYYIAHNKQLLGHSVDFLKIQGHLKNTLDFLINQNKDNLFFLVMSYKDLFLDFLFHGLVLKCKKILKYKKLL